MPGKMERTSAPSEGEEFAVTSVDLSQWGMVGCDEPVDDYVPDRIHTRAKRAPADSGPSSQPERS